MLGWCSTGHHDQCHHEYERFYFDIRGKLVMTGEIVKCQCNKRGCKCYVAGTKKTNRRRKTK